ncbi:hypothetical protein SLS61_003410 [Didymella pomorum]
MPSQSLQETLNLTSSAQIPSSLRLYRSHDSLFTTPAALPGSSASLSASRRTTPKDSMHKYTFGQRPVFAAPPNSTVFARPAYADDGRFNPRLSTSKAQYRSLATLPRPLPSSLRVAVQPGPRHPPWGSLECLEEQRGRRVDRRERNQAQRFRAQTLSEATTVLGSTDGFEDAFGKEAMKREVEGLRRQVRSITVGVEDFLPLLEASEQPPGTILTLDLKFGSSGDSGTLGATVIEVLTLAAPASIGEVKAAYQTAG